MSQTLRVSSPWWTTAAFVVGGLAAVQFGTRAVLWFLPYHVAGLFNEMALLAVAALVGLLIFVGLRRRSTPTPGRTAIIAGAMLYVVSSAAGFGWSPDAGLGFNAHRYSLFSTPECEFTVRFERPPQRGRVKGVLSVDETAGEEPLLYVAVLAEIATATAFRAECLPLPATRDPDQVAQQLASGMRRWADENAISVSAMALESDQRGRIFLLDGAIGGSILPEQEGTRSKTLVGLRSYLGNRSVMTVYVFQPRGDALAPAAAAFLDGVRRR